MRRVVIDQTEFLMGFGRDSTFVDEVPQTQWLDLETAEITWLYDDDEEAELIGGIPPEENARGRETIEAAPDRFLEIEPLDHGDHHAILQEFLASDWTRDPDTRRAAQEAYFGSIGAWKGGR
jgi:hypothetical protein